MIIRLLTEPAPFEVEEFAIIDGYLPYKQRL